MLNKRRKLYIVFMLTENEKLSKAKGEQNKKTATERKLIQSLYIMYIIIIGLVLIIVAKVL